MIINDLTCQHCGKQYKRTGWLWRHSLKIHGKPANLLHAVSIYYDRKFLEGVLKQTTYLPIWRTFGSRKLIDGCKKGGREVKFFRFKP